MDLVIPYVNGSDPAWRTAYLKKSNEYRVLQLNPIQRYRDTKLLKYVFRSIALNMPFIDNIYLIVSHISQVPNWLSYTTDLCSSELSKVKVVLHSDIIKFSDDELGDECKEYNKKYVPAFSSNVIEMFINNIPNLSNEFIYTNDDILAWNECSIDDFFTTRPLPRCGSEELSGNNSKTLYSDSSITELIPKISFKQVELMNSQFSLVCNNCYELIKDALLSENFKINDSSLLPAKHYFKPAHMMTPMRKDHNLELIKLLKDKGLYYKSLTIFRDKVNFNQYMYSNYLKLINSVDDSNMLTKYFKLSFIDIMSMITSKLIKDKDTKLICINDVDSIMPRNLNQLVSILDTKFNDKCKYEL